MSRSSNKRERIADRDSDIELRIKRRKNKINEYTIYDEIFQIRQLSGAAITFEKQPDCTILQINGTQSQMQIGESLLQIVLLALDYSIEYIPKYKLNELMTSSNNHQIKCVLDYITRLLDRKILSVGDLETIRIVKYLVKYIECNKYLQYTSLVLLYYIIKLHPCFIEHIVEADGVQILFFLLTYRANKNSELALAILNKISIQSPVNRRIILVNCDDTMKSHHSDTYDESLILSLIETVGFYTSDDELLKFAIELTSRLLDGTNDSILNRALKFLNEVIRQQSLTLDSGIIGQNLVKQLMRIIKEHLDELHVQTRILSFLSYIIPSEHEQMTVEIFMFSIPFIRPYLNHSKLTVHKEGLNLFKEFLYKLNENIELPNLTESHVIVMLKALRTRRYQESVKLKLAKFLYNLIKTATYEYLISLGKSRPVIKYTIKCIDSNYNVKNMNILVKLLKILRNLLEKLSFSRLKQIKFDLDDYGGLLILRNVCKRHDSECKYLVSRICCLFKPTRG